MSMCGTRVIVVTGASRGIGLGLVKELVKVPSCVVVATCRQPSQARELHQVLEQSGQQPPMQLDVASDESVQNWSKILKERGLMVTELINNAGISTPKHPHEDVSSIVRAEMMSVFNTNVAGVAAVTTASGVLDRPGTKVINVSSLMGSISKLATGNSPSYRASKAALNMLTACFAKSYPENIFVMLHPGWVQTDMGGSAGRTADINIEESVNGILKVIEGLDISQNGSFLDWRGNQIPV